MPGPPAHVEAEIAQNAADKKALEDAETQRQIMAMTNDPDYVTPLTSYDDSEDIYFDGLLQKISWAYDSIFTEADAEKLAEDVEFSEDDITGMTSKGFSKDSAPNNQTSMWRELSASQTGTEKKIVHYFQQVYKKLGCCMGKDQLTVNIPRYNRATKKMETTERTIVIDRATCKINGVDYGDDNFSEGGYKPACEKFMKRFIAFLLKYEPTNPMIKKYGGCLANKFLSEGVKTNPKLHNIINNNRSCTVNECSASSYKRLGDRKNCETVFCEAITNISDIDAGRDASLQTSISQNCGASAAQDYAKKTEDKPETEEDKIAEEVEEVVEETLEAQEELQEAKAKLAQAETPEEKEAAEKEVAEAEKKVAEAIKVDTTVADEEGFMFHVGNFFRSIGSFFSNLFGGKSEGFTNLKSNYRYLIIFALIASITVYVYRKKVFKIIKYLLKNPPYIPLF